MIRRFPTAIRILFALSAFFSIADGPPRMLARVAAALADRAQTEPQGSDVFVTPREALLREKPSTVARTVAKLAAGTRLTLLESGDVYLKVELPGAPNAPPRSGFVAREVAAVFGPGPEATEELVLVGRIFAKNDTNRRLAAALLARASERKRAANAPDAALEVLLGETAEALAAAGEPFPPGLDIVPRRTATDAHFVYVGPAFARALELTASASSPELAAVRERAQAGALRVQYPERSVTLAALSQETASWLALAQSADDPDVLRRACGRLGDAGLALARALLATGKQEELGRLEERLRAAAARVQALAPAESDALRLSARIGILRAMRGAGGASFPQEARVDLGPKQRTVRIDGKLGALALTVETRVGGTREARTRTLAVPVLPVPGSLRISPDGHSAAWVEVAGPYSLLPVVTSLDRDEPAREIAFLSGNGALRERGLAHVNASLSGFSKDSQRLGLAFEAWTDQPAQAPRYSVVAVATGQVLFETTKDLRGFERLMQ